MSRTCISWLSVCLSLLLAGGALGSDFEAQLLKKFQNDNQAAAQRLKQEVEGLLAQADAYRTAEPERALALYQKCLPLLGEPQWNSEDRKKLERKVSDGVRQAKASVEQKRLEEASQAASLKKDNAAAGLKSYYPLSPMQPVVSPPLFFAPVVTPFPSNIALQTTPVVSADRRYVRIGVSGGFSFFRPGPIVPVQIPVPTVLQGPGNGVTVLPPIGVTQKITPVVLPAFTGIGVNTTVMAPAGGTAVVGGFASVSSSRVEFGTPILGRIPYLSPFYRSVATGSQMNALQLSVSPQIILLE